MPRVIEVGVASTSAVSEPRTTATTTSNFPRSSDDAAFGAYCRRRDCYCVYVGIGQSTKKLDLGDDLSIYIHGVSLGLTVAGLDALKPPVISDSVAGTAAILIPSAARGAATDSAGFLERATL